MGVDLLWHRIQFAFTITFHYLFPQLTMGLAFLPESLGGAGVAAPPAPPAAEPGVETFVIRQRVEPDVRDLYADALAKTFDAAPAARRSPAADILPEGTPAGSAGS